MTPDRPLDESRQSQSEALDLATVDTVLDSLFATVPPPYVMAIAETGQCVPMPAGVPVAAGQTIAGIGSPLELCIPADLGPVVETWERARKTRGAQVVIHLRSEPSRAVTLHCVDARHRYGVFLGFLIGKGGPAGGQTAPALPFGPRMCILIRDELSIIRKIDDATTKILGWEADDLIGTKTLELVHPDDRVVAIANWMEMLGRHGEQNRVLMRYRHRAGNFMWFEVTNYNLLSDPEHSHVRTEMLDVSERMDAVEALRASEQLLRRLTETLPLGILQIDAERRIVYRNERLAGIVDVAAATSIAEQFANVAPADGPLLDAALDALLSAGEPADIELTIAHAGRCRRCSVGIRALTAENGLVTGAIMCIADITERVRMREELETRAKYDNLTRCHNRTSILEALDSVITGAGRPELGMAVLFVDLDRFKLVNDKYGHAAGDELLRRTGERLLQCVRSVDIVGRLGGDEFLIVCPEVTSPQGALDIARRIGEALAERVMLGSVPLLPGSSIGVAWTNRRIDTDTLVASADAAMYESKRGDHAPVLRLASARMLGMTGT